MNWVLIAMLSVASTTAAPTMVTAEFADKDACATAAQVIREYAQMSALLIKVHVGCIPKGTEKK